MATPYPVVAASIKHELVSRGIHVIGEPNNIVDTLRLLEDSPPEILVVDGEMPLPTGRTVEQSLDLSIFCSYREQPLILLLGTAYHSQHTSELLTSIRGYVLKEEALETIAIAVQAVAQGATFFSSSVLMQLTSQVQKGNARNARLTGRELEVLRLLACGWSNPRISQELTVTTQTVKNHVRNIYRKIETTSRVEAAMRAVHMGLVTDEDLNNGKWHAGH
ncbi:MAG: response regulator transcription factor [Aggregatilineales bacterium]